MHKNDFIIIRGTRCYFIDANTFIIRTGIIVGYDNISRRVTLKVKNNFDSYDVLYRNRDYIWFDLEECLLWLTDYLRDSGMLTIKVMDLTSQLNGTNNVLKLQETLGDKYTIFLNGLRQDRNDYEVDNNNLTLTLLFNTIPSSKDTLIIEYWKTSELPE